MKCVVGGFLALVLGWSPVPAEAQSQDRPATPAEQYKALLKESQARVQRDPQGIRGVGAEGRHALG